MKPAPGRSYPAGRLLPPLVRYFHIGQLTKGSHGIDLLKSGLKQGHTAGNVLDEAEKADRATRAADCQPGCAHLIAGSVR